MEQFLNQSDYNLICEILQSGAPALANRLILKLSNTINDWQRLSKEEQEAETAQSKKE